MRWPGHIPADTVCDEPVMTIDLLPTIARLAGAEVPEDRIIDGRDIWPLMAGEPGAKNPHEVLYFYFLDGLQAVRAGRWKLHVPHGYRHVTEPGHDGRPGRTRSGARSWPCTIWRPIGARPRTWPRASGRRRAAAGVRRASPRRFGRRAKRKGANLRPRRHASNPKAAARAELGGRLVAGCSSSATSLGRIVFLADESRALAGLAPFAGRAAWSERRTGRPLPRASGR